MTRLASFLVVTVLIVPAVAGAYVPSPQNAAFELKFGPYTPAIDKSLDGTPYQSTYGRKPMFLTVLELDWQFWHPPGISLGLGGSAGFMQAYAKSKTVVGDGPSDVDSADFTVLNVIPFSVLFIARVDALADMLDVPIVPFFKTGVNWYVWWNHEGGQLGDIDGKQSSGGSPGWQINTGLMLRLDSFDRMSARTFDNEVGVNHSYIFAELLWAWVDGFGDDTNLNLSTDTFAGMTFLAGLCLEF